MVWGSLQSRPQILMFSPHAPHQWPILAAPSPPSPCTVHQISAPAPQCTSLVIVRRVCVPPMNTHRSTRLDSRSIIIKHSSTPLLPLSPPQHLLPSAHCAQGHSFPIVSFRAHPPFITCTHTPHFIYILPEA